MSDNKLTVSDAVCEAVRELVLARTDDPSALLVTDDEIRQVVAEESSAQRARLLDAARVQVRASLAERDTELSAAMAAAVAKVSALDFTPSGPSDLEEAQRLLAEAIAERRANPEAALERQLRDGEIEVLVQPVSLEMRIEVFEGKLPLGDCRVRRLAIRFMKYEHPRPDPADVLHQAAAADCRIIEPDELLSLFHFWKCFPWDFTVTSKTYGGHYLSVFRSSSSGEDYVSAREVKEEISATFFVRDIG